MNYEWIQEYCLSKEGAVKDYKIEWEAIRYLIGNKMFAMIGEDKNKKEIITLKCETTFGQLLREKYQHIVPGYYMNKQYWNSVYMNGDVPDDILKQMIDMSHELVFKSLGATPIHEPQDMPWNQRTALFADPDGNIHEIFAEII